ncbi:hydroxyneurosporene methyltransferase [Micractinium conductrix]|uniref:Hydroxyneurosporene methyltransferase n=1 Tax=Micractinium conductrix TaxID=554055 RepID=A0A2P6VMN6_9CHLO|nr:hydroxyneurosporene methyltransferase [Micractinium conductrix]|eukprot:PSC75358.1 hydroxyneurosporene methyltransferase [Micractinium conductrix]
MAMRQALVALAGALRGATPSAPLAGGVRAFASQAPSVYDRIVQLTVVDGEGRRHVVRGLVGQNIVEVLEQHMDTLGEEAVCLSPEGRDIKEAHVKLPNELLGAYPAPAGDDAFFLNEIAVGTDGHSRLGSKLAMGFAHSKALYALTHLGVADELAAAPGGTLPAQQLAARLGVKADELRRLLRATAANGVFAGVSPGVFANNRGSSVLRRHHPTSLHSMVQVWGDESYWGHKQLAESLRPGSPHSFQLQTGGPGYFEWLSQPGNERRSRSFHNAMDYPWGRHANQSLCDVGGGVGGFLAPLLRAQPSMRGVLVDLPGVVADAEVQWRLRQPDLLRRATLAGADFCADPLPSADIYFLRYVLHDWGDPEARRILAAVRSAMGGGQAGGVAPKGLLLIQEAVLSDGPLSPLYAGLDLQMLSIAGDKERSRREWQQLLAAAGFGLRRVHRLRTLTSIIEAAAQA